MICRECNRKIDGRKKRSKLYGVCDDCESDDEFNRKISSDEFVGEAMMRFNVVEPVELRVTEPIELRVTDRSKFQPVVGMMSEEAVEEEECKEEKKELYPVAGMDLSGKKPKKRFWEFWK